MSDRWSTMRCLVTGGAGFGGSHLVAELVQRGAYVTVIDRAPKDDTPLRALALDGEFAWIEADIRDTATLEPLVAAGRFDAVFHLAADPIVANSLTDPAAVVDANVRGTAAVLEAIRQAETTPLLVFASSGAYYGDSFDPDPIPEDRAPGPAANLYGPSKAAAEMLVRGYGRTFGIPHASCRFMNTYGPGDVHQSRLVPRALAQLARGEEYDFGDRDDGSTRLDFLYVGDMARAYLAAADHVADGGAETAFNFGTGTLTSVREVAERVSSAYDDVPREPAFRGHRSGPIRQKRLDVSLAAQVLGWSAQTSLQDGIAATVAWHKGATAP